MNIMCRLATNFGVLMILVAAGVVCLNQFDTLPPLSSEKYDALERQFERVNTIFAGSSHMYRQFDPALLDSIMNTNGISTLTLNLGMDGMYALETHLVVERILEMRPPNLELIILELQQIIPIHPDIFSTVRVARYHDFTRTFAVCKMYLENDKCRPHLKITELANRLMLFTKHIMLWGRGLELLEIHMNHSYKINSHKYSDDSVFTGFQPLDDDLDAVRPDKRRRYHKWRQEFLAPAGQERFRKHIEFLERERANEREIEKSEEANVTFWLDLVQQCQSEGIHCVFVVPPGAIGLKYIAEEIRSNNNIVLELNSPSVFPALYQVGHWHDHGHLNEKGAVLVQRQSSIVG